MLEEEKMGKIKSGRYLKVVHSEEYLPYTDMYQLSIIFLNSRSCYWTILNDLVLCCLVYNYTNVDQESRIYDCIFF